MPPELETQVLLILGEIKGDVKNIHARLDRMDTAFEKANEGQDMRIAILEKKCTEIGNGGENVGKKAIAAVSSISTIIGGLITGAVTWFATGKLPWGGS